MGAATWLNRIRKLQLSAAEAEKRPREIRANLSESSLSCPRGSREFGIANAREKSGHLTIPRLMVSLLSAFPTRAPARTSPSSFEPRLVRSGLNPDARLSYKLPVAFWPLRSAAASHPLASTARNPFDHHRARARCFSRAQIALLAGPADEWSAGPELAPVEPVYTPISAGGRGKVRRALFGDGSGSGENLVVFESARQATARIQSVKRAAEKSLSSSRV